MSAKTRCGEWRLPATRTGACCGSRNPRLSPGALTKVRSRRIAAALHPSLLSLLWLLTVRRAIAASVLMVLSPCFHDGRKAETVSVTFVTRSCRPKPSRQIGRHTGSGTVSRQHRLGPVDASGSAPRASQRRTCRGTGSTAPRTSTTSSAQGRTRSAGGQPAWLPVWHARSGLVYTANGFRRDSTREQCYLYILQSA